MKVVEFKEKMPLRSKILILFSVLLTIAIVSVIVIYICDEGVRNWIDVYVLRKEVTEDDIATIELDVDKNESVYAYSNNITILYNGKLSIYNSYASEVAELDISISNPIYDTDGDYLGIAEKNGQNIYLISNNKILWENKLEGNISKINVNRNGMTSVIITGTSYKSLIKVFDKDGKELFTSFVPYTIVIDSDISVDEKYLAIAKVDTSGALIQSSIEVVDIEKALNEEDNSTVYIHKADSGKIITDIKYQEKGQLVCIYNDSIHMIYNDEDTVLTEFEKTTQIADINLKSNIVRADEISTGLFSVKTDIKLKNILTGVETLYSVDSSIKEIVCYNQISAINLGTEIHFINLNGWLEKKYTARQETKQIVLGTSVAGIVYRDKIKVLAF